MSAMESIPTRELAERAKAITKRELGVYIERTKGSQVATERARKVLPLGVPSLSLIHISEPTRPY